MLIKMASFREKWLAAVENKNSILCAGLDPAEFEMGRTEKGEGLPKTVDKLEWAEKYIEAVAPYCAAVKPNIQYWKKHAGGNSRRISDMDALVEIVQMAHARGLVVIDDSKLADIGSTNDAGVYHSQDKKYDAVTFSPFAGNMQEASNQAFNRNLGLICMCLMSNPEYETEKNAWKDVSKNVGDYVPADVVFITDPSTHQSVPHVRQYIQLARDSTRFGLSGVVIGAPSPKNHIKEYEVVCASTYLDKDKLILVPGIGAQGGEISILSKYFDMNHLIANVGRGLMFPNGAESTPEQQAEAAKNYQKMLNELREK